MLTYQSPAAADDAVGFMLRQLHLRVQSELRATPLGSWS